jgi:Universal stress protein family
MSHLLMGSVAERVVRTAACPVLTIRHAREVAVVKESAEVAVELPPGLVATSTADKQC